VEERLVSLLSGSFAAVALLLVAIGLYGRFAYSVVERTKEIGIRVALGAEQSAIAGMIIRETMLLVACGTVVAVPVAMISVRAFARLLYGTGGADPFTVAAAIATVSSAAAVAVWRPARRASRVDPVVA